MILVIISVILLSNFLKYCSFVAKISNVAFVANIARGITDQATQILRCTIHILGYLTSKMTILIKVHVAM